MRGMTQATITAAEIQRCDGLEKFLRRMEQPDTRRILSVCEPEAGTAARKTPPVPREDEEQAAVIAWAKRNERCCPALRMLFHVPNGGHRGKATAARLVAQGVKPGVPDLCLPVPRGNHHGLWIEMKRLKSSGLTTEQKRWLEQLNAHGYRAVMCRGAGAAIAEIKAYLETGV